MIRHFLPSSLSSSDLGAGVVERVKRKKPLSSPIASPTQLGSAATPLT